MPMGGGTFTAMNKVLPGAYINFVSTAGSARMGTRGVAALPLELNWGPEGVYILEAGAFNQEAVKVFGYDPTAPELLLVREALKRCKTLLVYRVNGGGDKAAATVGGLAVTARYAGTRGNDLKAAVRANADDDGQVDVVTYLGTEEKDVQTVAAAGGAKDLKGNDFVTFGNAETLSPAAATPLTGGTNKASTGQSYADFLAALEVEAFNTVGYPGSDESVKALVAAFVKRLRYDEGRKVVGVLHGFAGDDIGIVNVKNGVVLTDGTTIPGEGAVAWVAGAVAGATVSQSLTNTAYDGAVDVDKKYTKGQYEAAIRAGEFVFYADGGKARVLSDINSLTTFSQGVSEDWTSNRVVRVMDGWAEDVARIFGEQYLGTTNNASGRNLFKADLVSLGGQYEAIDAISDFSPDDVTVEQGAGKRDVVVQSALLPNDGMEKLYMTVIVN